MRINFLYSW